MSDNTIVFPIIRHDMIEDAITSLARNAGHEYKVIVVDQTQTNPMLIKWLIANTDLYIRPRVNYGFAQASNIGARLATTEYVTICNDDVVFFSDQWWQGTLDTFERFETCVAVNPMSPKEPGWGYGEEGFRMHATLEECFEDPGSVVDVLSQKWDNGKSVVDAFAMWCTVMKRDVWVDELGMFDERFIPGSGEDYDAMARIYQAGHRALSTPTSWVWHHWGQSKDEPTGHDVALPIAREPWNKLSTKGFGDKGVWREDCDVWGKGCERTGPVVRMPL